MNLQLPHPRLGHRDLARITGGMTPSQQFMRPDFSINAKALGSSMVVGAVGGGFLAAAAGTPTIPVGALGGGLVGGMGYCAGQILNPPMVPVQFAPPTVTYCQGGPSTDGVGRATFIPYRTYGWR